MASDGAFSVYESEIIGSWERVRDLLTVQKKRISAAISGEMVVFDE